MLGDVDGLDVVELGCGTAYFSAWLARRGARPVGVDITPAQLETARRMQAETGIEFPLVEADAGATGLPDASFDLALSEYGASIWVDPYRWVPEAARLLRPGGRLVFLRNSTLLTLCYPDDEDAPASETLQRPQRGLRRLDWGDARRVPPRPRRVDRRAARQRLRDRAARRALPDRRRARRIRTTSARRSSGRASGRPRRSGSRRKRVSVAARTAAAARLDLAAAARDPDAARHPVRGRRAGSRRGSRRPRRSSARPGRRARSTAAGGPCSASTPRCCCDGELLGKPGDASEAEAMLERIAGRTHEVVSGPLPAHARRGRSCTRETTRVTIRPLTPRELGRYVAARRVGGPRRRLRDPGSRREPRRADRGRLPQRRRPSRRAARRGSSPTRFPGAYGFG